ncbi:MAG: SPOR domain-containing protein [Treponema sp.]|jgi:cell division septation protein DedD|nr:SPOR domain-containing protein [Treponema sp.]
MKKVMLTAMLCVMALVPGAAQVLLGNYSQWGAAGVNLQDGGISAAHPLLPLSSKAIIKNPLNEKEIEVVIVDHIPPSLDRIIQLSPAAANVLEITDGGLVIVMVPMASRSRPAERAPQIVSLEDAPPAPPPLIEDPLEAPPAWPPLMEDPPEAPPAWPPLAENPPAADVAAGGSGKQNPAAAQEPPINVTVWLDMEEARPAAVSPAAQKVPPPKTPAQSGATAQTAGEVRILPRLPDRLSGKKYRLQVGAFSSALNANRAIQSLRSAGFTAVQEEYGRLHRVIAVDIPAADVPAAAIRLGRAGFTEIWVRD